MSRLSSRVCTTIATLAIVLLVVFLAMLWSGINTSSKISSVGEYKVKNTSDLHHNFHQDQDRVPNIHAVTFASNIDHTSPINDGEFFVFFFSFCSHFNCVLFIFFPSTENEKRI